MKISNVASKRYEYAYTVAWSWRCLKAPPPWSTQPYLPSHYKKGTQPPVAVMKMIHGMTFLSVKCCIFTCSCLNPKNVPARWSYFMRMSHRFKGSTEWWCMMKANVHWSIRVQPAQTQVSRSAGKKAITSHLCDASPCATAMNWCTSNDMMLSDVVLVVLDSLETFTWLYLLL